MSVLQRISALPPEGDEFERRAGVRQARTLSAEVKPQRRQQLLVQVEAEIRWSVTTVRISLTDPARDVGDEPRVGEGELVRNDGRS
jgi:hypothetical protein